MDLPSGESGVVVQLEPPAQATRCSFFLRILDADVTGGAAVESSSSEPQR
jgi:hypothetical protein